MREKVYYHSEHNQISALAEQYQRCGDALPCMWFGLIAAQRLSTSCSPVILHMRYCPSVECCTCNCQRIMEFCCSQ